MGKTPEQLLVLGSRDRKMPVSRELVGKVVAAAEGLPSNPGAILEDGSFDDRGGNYQLPSCSAPSSFSARLRLACEPI